MPGTKNAKRKKAYRQAKIWALSFNLELAMDKPEADDFDLSHVDPREFDVVLPDGTQIKNIETAEDVRLAKEMLGDRLAAPLDLPVFTPAMVSAIAAQQANSAPKNRGKPFADVVKLYRPRQALASKSQRRRSESSDRKRLELPLR